MGAGRGTGRHTRARIVGALLGATALGVAQLAGAARADDALVAVDTEIPDGWIEFIEESWVGVELPAIVSEIASGVDGLVPAVRFAGRNRSETARLIAVNETGYAARFGGSDSTAVIVARGDAYPDSLAASYLTGHTAAPVVLTNSDSVNPNLQQTLDHWGGPDGVDVVYVLGGPSAISLAVEGELVADGYTVKRLGGDSRSATAGMIAREFGAAGVGVDGSGQRTAIVASGSDHADALVAAPLAAARRFPLLLTGPDALSGATSEALEDLGIQRVLLAGGTAVVSGAVESQIADIVGDVDRVAGGSRFETAVSFARKVVQEFGFSEDHIGLADGGDFPDALGLAPHAGLGGEGPFPVLLGGATLPTATGEYFEDIAACGFRGLHIAGGTAAISDAQAIEAREALTDQSDDGCAVLAAVLGPPGGAPGPEFGDDNGHGTARLVIGSDAGDLCYQVIAWSSEEFVLTQGEMVTGTAASILDGDGTEVVALEPPDAGWVYACVDVDDATKDAILSDPSGFWIKLDTTEWPNGAMIGQLEDA